MGDELGQGGRDAAAERVDRRCHELPAAGPVGLAVGRDHALVDAQAASTRTWSSTLNKAVGSAAGRTCVTRLYTRLELQAMLGAAGYCDIRMYGGFSGGQISDFARTVFVARK